jgi:protein-disulfide isomerase
MTLTRRSLLLITAAFAALAATGAWADTTAPAAADAAATGEIQDFGIGDVNAKVKIAEYLSLTCPHCEHFHSEIYPKLKADYIDTGKVRLEYHEVYFDQYGLLGAMVARCGGELRYVGIIDMLYDRQRDWAGTDDIGTVAAELKKIGRTAGMTDDQVDACLKDQKVAEALVAHYQSSIARDFPNDSFSGTPSFIVNGVVNKDITSNMSYDALKQIIDAELAK